MAIEYEYYPHHKNEKIEKKWLDLISQKVLDAYEKEISIQTSYQEKNGQIKSDDVMSIIRQPLEKIGFKVETGRIENKRNQIRIAEKEFYVDCYNKEKKYVIEIEASRGYRGNQFLKDFFEAAISYEIDYLCIAVRKEYFINQKSNDRHSSHDFENVKSYFEAMNSEYSKMQIPFKGLLLIGY